MMLGAGSFETKKKETEERRSDRLSEVRIAWVVVGVIAILILYAVSWFFLRWRFYAAMHAAALISLACVCSMFLLVNTASTEFTAKRSMPGMPSGGEPVLVSDTESGGGGAVPMVRVRDQFPETMLWQPQLVTDDTGHATLEIDLADSITTWRLSGSAVTADGRLGSLQTGIRVFQPFFVDWNLPVALTRNDEIDLPAVVSNFLPTPQTVEVTLARGDGFELIGADVQTVALKAKEVRSVSFRIRAKKAGRIDLRLTAKAGELTDALKRSIEVLPDGRRVESVTNGTLTAPATVALDVPPDAIDGSARATVRIYPSAFSQVVEGLDGIFKLPTGCFEQTSSSLYPNVMALNYLRQTGKSAPAVEAKARGYIHVGYQRLLKFEVPGGGFDWYGNPPANVMLTAYGLMEFRDMAAVHDVDPKLIERTRNWLLSRREADGSWFASLHVGRSPNADEDRLRATAYVAWAVFDGSAMDADSTRKFLLNHLPDSISDPYILALVANALTAIDPKGESATPYLARLESLKHVSADDRQTWWELPPNSMTVFYGSGPSGNVETTALAALAFLKAGIYPADLRGSLAWLAERQDANGLWGSTQATIQALKALLAGGKPAGDGNRSIEIALDGRPVQTLEIPADQAEVMKQIDLSALLKPGSHAVSLRDLQGSGIAFQVAFRYHVPGENPTAGKPPFTVEWKCDRTAVTVNEIVTATATLTNRTQRSATMAMAELPIPAGFILDGTPTAVPSAAIDRQETTPRQCILYLRELVPNRPVVITYRLKAAVPANATVPPVRVYEYYNPTNEGRGSPSRLAITAPNPKTELERR
jgi:uncharacterized protein YfaS (alpha-2-macroglobulin family)